MKSTVLALSLLLTPLASYAGSCCAAEPEPAPEMATSLPARSLYRMEGAFTDDQGRTVRPADLRGSPVMLTLFFARCKMACPTLVSDLTRIRALLPEDARARTKIVLVSFDSENDTQEVLARFRAERELGPEWVLLRGEPDAVSELAALCGVKYRREADGTFAHSNLITVLDANGEVAHRRNGLSGGIEDTARAVALLP